MSKTVDRLAELRRAVRKLAADQGARVRSSARGGVLKQLRVLRRRLDAEFPAIPMKRRSRRRALPVEMADVPALSVMTALAIRSGIRIAPSPIPGFVLIPKWVTHLQKRTNKELRACRRNIHLRKALLAAEALTNGVKL